MEKEFKPMKLLPDGTKVELFYEKLGGATHVYVLDVDVPHCYGSAFTLIVAPDNALLVACTEAQDWSIEVNAEEYGFDFLYPESEETKAKIFDELYNEFVGGGE